MKENPYRMAFYMLGLPLLFGAPVFWPPLFSAFEKPYGEHLFGAIWCPQTMFLVAFYFATACVFLEVKRNGEVKK